MTNPYASFEENNNQSNSVLNRMFGSTPNMAEIPLENIDPFPDNPYPVEDNDSEMRELVESIKENGILTPATVIKNGERYMLVSGHRRKRALELLGLHTLKCVILPPMSDDEVMVQCVNSNIYRQLSLSTKCKAYKARYEAMQRLKEKAKKTPEAFSEDKIDELFTGRLDKKIATETGESQTQVRRYVRMGNLVPELLESLDKNKLKQGPAYELSFLPTEIQQTAFETAKEEKTPLSIDLAKELHAANEKDPLTAEQTEAIIKKAAVNKPKAKPKPQTATQAVSEAILNAIPEDYKGTPKAIEQYILAAIAYYKRMNFYDQDDGDEEFDQLISRSSHTVPPAKRM